MQNFRVNIGLINPKSPQNVGSVLRAAANFRVDSIYYSGQRYPRALELNPDTPNTRRKLGQDIPIAGVDNLLDHIPENSKVVCVELAENAQSLPGYVHPENAFYIFGPEDGTISQHIIDRADDVVYVPTIGCMNLAASVNVLLYDRLLKSSCRLESNDLIRQSRDTNNHIKVKV